MKIAKLFAELDFLAPEVSLNINGKSGVKTKVGSCVWLVAAGCFVASTVITLGEFFSTNNPKVSSETSSSAVYPPINLIDGSLVPMIWPQYLGIRAVPFEEVSKFVTLIATKQTFTSERLEDGTYDIKL